MCWVSKRYLLFGWLRKCVGGMLSPLCKYLPARGRRYTYCIINQEPRPEFFFSKGWRTEMSYLKLFYSYFKIPSSIEVFFFQFSSCQNKKKKEIFSLHLKRNLDSVKCTVEATHNIPHCIASRAGRLGLVDVGQLTKYLVSTHKALGLTPALHNQAGWSTPVILARRS